jgi:glycosyltransferase involved in cell wall biosynthesis
MTEELVIVFAYHFPPENAIGGVRPYRFYKYLGRLGVHCHVITAANVFSRPDLDAQFVEDPFVTRPRQGTGWQIERAVRKFLLPGVTGTQWSIAAYRRARDYLRAHSHGRVTILSTYPPLGTLLAAYLLARKTGHPWIADFRDPLAHNPGSGEINGVHDAAYRCVERVFLQYAQSVIANTDAARDQLVAKYPKWAQKIHLLWNGFDPEQRLNPAPLPSRKQRIYSHTGELYEGRDIRKLLFSIQRLIAAGRLDPTEFQVQLLGPVRHTSIPDETFVSVATEQGWLRVVPYQVPQNEAQHVNQTSDGLLLVQPHSMLQVPGKLYEYIQIGRPILAFILPGSPIDRILKQSGIPYQCAYATQEDESFDEAVLQYFRMPITTSHPSPWFADNFNVQNHAEQLYRIIGKLHRS